MGDEDEVLPSSRWRRSSLGLQLFADDRVDGAERLVHQQDVRVDGKAAGDADALLLPPDSWRGSARRARSRPTRSISSSARSRAALLATPVSTGTVATLSMHRAMRQQPGVLHHVPDPAPQPDRLTRAMSSPSIRMFPSLGSTMRLIIRSRVVLPQPDEPTNTVVLCDGMTRLKSSTAAVPSAKGLVTWRNSIAMLSFRRESQAFHRSRTGRRMRQTG